MSLPQFANPPVIETVLGVQFDRIDGFSNAHLGAFWKRLGADWPTAHDAVALPPDFERFGEHSWVRAGLQLKISHEQAVRIQIGNHSNDGMIQLQNGRLLFNWLGHQGGQYPRYEDVRQKFDVAVDELRRFLKDESLGDLQFNQWEVTYVNHIPKGTVWTTPADWKNIFGSQVVLNSELEDCHFETFGGEWNYVIGDQLGRLHAKINHAKINEQPEILRFSLTARGPVGSENTRGLTLDAGLDLGRNVIVKSFKSLTSISAHKYWGLQT